MMYLILHKVRGSPAFDIAEKTKIGDEEGWVLCTCGYRAYPWWYTELGKWDFMDYSGADKALNEMPPDALDCFPKRAAPKETVDISAFLHEMVKIKRRM